MDLKEQQALGTDPATHWYYIAKGRAIKTILEDEPAEYLMDVGAGSGVFARTLLDAGLAKVADCIDPHYGDTTLWASTPHLRFLRQAEKHRTPDLVTMIDVIEHVDDDAGLIRDYAALAKPGARFLITVPAFQFLWSSHDEFLDHRRRYTLEQLEETVMRAGLEIADSRYFFGTLFPAVAALRMASRLLRQAAAPRKSDMRPARGWFNKALVSLHDWERHQMFPHNRVAGVTAMCLARKPAAVSSQGLAA